MPSGGSSAQGSAVSIDVGPPTTSDSAVAAPRDTGPGVGRPRVGLEPLRGSAVDGPTPAGGGTGATAVDERSLGVIATLAAVLLSGGAAAWMAGGLFSGLWPRPLALAGLVLGAGLVSLSFVRPPRPPQRPRWRAAQYLVLPLALVAGAAALFAAAGDASAGDLPRLVGDAVRTGGLGQPPVPFDPGWRFILVVFFAVLGAASASLAFGLNRANLGVVFALPALVATALIHPDSGSVVAGVVSLVLVMAALAVAHGAELAKDGATSNEFELRRLARAGAMVAVAAVGVVGLSRAGFLFPEPERRVSTPPKKPKAEAIAADKVLFRVQSSEPGPWRIGVLDVYDDNALRLPPFDRSRIDDLPDGGNVPGAPRRGPTVTAAFTLGATTGREIPNLANTQRVTGADFDVAYDSRTNVLRLADKPAASGMSYRVEAPAAPKAEELAQAPPPPPALRDFTVVPAPPTEVSRLLETAPGSSAWDRLTYVRGVLHQQVIIAGEGEAVDVPPARVAQMLRGAEASPFEISAAEVLLARWAGIPARLGYGYFGGERRGDVLEVHPKQAATWLEAYFQGFGWVPLTSVPPRAKGSLSEGAKQANASVQPSNTLTLTLHVPIRLHSIRQFYELVRFWLLALLPMVIGLVMLWRLYPSLVRVARRARRRRWAGSRGPSARIAVAYSEMRDAARDLNVGNARSTPLEFAAEVEADDELTELSWLVTRALWGDLRRDIRPEDADNAEELARSVTRRLRRGQPATTRLLALGSTASLRQPYSFDIPNLWPGPVDRASPAGWRGSRRRVAAASAVVVVSLAAALVATGVFTDDGSGDSAGDQRRVGPAIPDRLVPAALGGLAFQREPTAEKAFAKVGPGSLVIDGRVFTVRDGGDVRGYLQVVAMPPGRDARRDEVRRGVLSETAGGRFQPERRGGDRIYFGRLRDQTYRIWFSPDGRYYQLFVARQNFAEADRVFSAVLDYQRGAEAPTELKPAPVLIDPRRGGDGW